MTAGILESPFGMRWTSLATAVAMLAVIGVWKRRPFIAAVAVLAWASGFELTYRLVDILRWHEWWAWAGWVWEASALAGWPLAAYVFRIRPSPAWMAAVVLAFAVWWLSGYDYNLPQTAAGRGQPIRWVSEIENVLAKTTWAMAYLTAAVTAPNVVLLRNAAVDRAKRLLGV